MKENLSRRAFMEKIGVCTVGGTAFAQTLNRPASAQSAWSPPPTLTNPNILVIMVDQMRLPAWLSSAQQSKLGQILPNIVGRIQANSFNFGQYFAVGTN